MGFEIDEEESIEVPALRESTIPMTLKDAEKAIVQARIDLAIYAVKIKDMKTEANLLRVEDNDAHMKSVELGIRAKKLAKQIDTHTDGIREPAKKFDVAIRNFSKVYTTDLLAIEAITKRKNQAYKVLKEQREFEAQRKINDEAKRLQDLVNEEARATGTKPGKVVTPVLDTKERIVRTEEGVAYSSEYWKFEAGPVHRNNPTHPGIGRTRTIVYSHTTNERMREIGEKVGLTGDALNLFRFALNEVKFELEISEDGTAAIVSVNDMLLPIIPAEFLTPDKTELRKAIDAGRHTIEGVRIWRDDKEVYK